MCPFRIITDICQFGQWLTLCNEELFINQDVWWEFVKVSAGSRKLQAPVHYTTSKRYSFTGRNTTLRNYFLFSTILFPSDIFLTYFLDKTFNTRDLFFSFKRHVSVHAWDGAWGFGHFHSLFYADGGKRGQRLGQKEYSGSLSVYPRFLGYLQNTVWHSVAPESVFVASERMQTWAGKRVLKVAEQSYSPMFFSWGTVCFYSCCRSSTEIWFIAASLYCLRKIQLILRKILSNQPCAFCLLPSPVFHIPPWSVILA